MSTQNDTAPPERHHYVHFILESGDSPHPEFECRAPEDAHCRTFCQTCWFEAQEQCVCDHEGREPVITHGHPCNYLGWIENVPNESYDGAAVAVRGPEPEPISFHWEGDYYTWKYIA